MTTATHFGPDSLKEILTTNLGVSDEAVDDELTATLGELGVDSIGVLELQTVVRDQYAVELPETTGELNLGQIIDYVADSLKGAA
jgi:acyl carrier protein